MYSAMRAQSQPPGRTALSTGPVEPSRNPHGRRRGDEANSQGQYIFRASIMRFCARKRSGVGLFQWVNSLKFQLSGFSCASDSASRRRYGPGRSLSNGRIQGVGGRTLLRCKTRHLPTKGPRAEARGSGVKEEPERFNILDERLRAIPASRANPHSALEVLERRNSTPRGGPRSKQTTPE